MFRLQAAINDQNADIAIGIRLEVRGNECHSFLRLGSRNLRLTENAEHPSLSAGFRKNMEINGYKERPRRRQLMDSVLKGFGRWLERLYCEMIWLLTLPGARGEFRMAFPY
jgi:hypothetical protein